MKTIGFEIEYYIPNDKLLDYSILYTNPNKDNYGFDQENLLIAEYRSPVFNSSKEIWDNFCTIFDSLKKYDTQYNSTKKIARLKLYYGIHISFDNYSKLKLILLYLSIYFWRFPLLSIIRLFKVGIFRKHSERLEFRWIPTTNRHDLFYKFLNKL